MLLLLLLLLACCGGGMELMLHASIELVNSGRGHDCHVLAYGQTGSGKARTMEATTQAAQAA